MRAADGNLVSVTRGIIVHGCNAQGVMGSGVAKALREAYPQVYRDYRQAYESSKLTLGQVVWTRVSRDPPLAVANAITQQFYGRNPAVRYVDYEAVRTSLSAIAVIARKHNLPVHYPKIGAGLGNGDWQQLSAIIDETLAGLDHTLWLPSPTPGRRPGSPGTPGP